MYEFNKINHNYHKLCPSVNRRLEDKVGALEIGVVEITIKTRCIVVTKSKYFTGKYVFGVDDTLKALEMGDVEIVIVWENLDINRYVLKNSTTSEVTIAHLNKDQEADESNFRDSATNAELEVQEKKSLLEWLANEYKKFGCTLEFVTNKSQEGSQFCRAFGGIGGILRCQLDIRPSDDLTDDGENNESE